MGHMGELHGLLVLTSTTCVSKFSTISLIPCIASLLIRYCLVTGGGVPVNLTLWLCSDSCHTCGVPGQK